MMSKSKAKTNTWIKKEDPDGPKIKKEKSRRKKSESEDSEEEDRRITRKAKKKLGLSVSYVTDGKYPREMASIVW